MKYTLDEVNLFLKRIASDQTLMAAYLLYRFDGMYMSDLTMLLDTAAPRMVNIGVKLERSRIIEKKSVGIVGGRRVIFMRLTQDAKDVLSPFLDSLAADKAIIEAARLYQKLKEAKQLPSDRHSYIGDDPVE